MKRRFVMMLVLITLSCFCQVEAAPPKPVSGPVSLKAVTPPAVTATYPAAVFIAEIIKKALPEGSSVLTIPVPGRGGIEMVGSGKADMYISTHTFMDMAALKGDPRVGYKDAYPGITAIAQLADHGQLGVFQFVVAKNTGLNSFEEILKRKFPIKLATSIKASIAEVTTNTVLKTYGITYEDIRSWGGRVEHIGWREAVDAAKEGRIDALGTNAQYPYPFFVELGVSKPINLLSMSDDVITKLEKDLPGLERHTIPVSEVKDYRGVEKDVNTVATGFLVIVRPGLPDELVYTLTKTIVENHKPIAEQYAGHKYFNPETAVKHLSGFPMHPMALQYYKDAGVLK